MTNAIWKPELLELLTNLCNIPLNSELISFRVDHGTPVNKNVVGVCVYFQKPEQRLLKYKSPSTLRHNKLRSENRQLRKHQRFGLGNQAGPTSLSSSQLGPDEALISANNNFPVTSSTDVSIETKTTSMGAPSGTNNTTSTAASQPETIFSHDENKN